MMLSLVSVPRLERGSGSIGLFSRLLSPWVPSKSVVTATWNARALLHHKPRLRAKKIRYLLSFALGSDWTALQEVHGSQARFVAALPALQKDFHIFSTFSTNPNEGGV
eukprot:12171079-Karenia_brevis.AAC.1